MITSKLTSNRETTLPQTALDALGVKEGDLIAYRIEGDRVVLSKVRVAAEGEDAFRISPEWEAEAEAERIASADLLVRRNGSRSFPL